MCSVCAVHRQTSQSERSDQVSARSVQCGGVEVSGTDRHPSQRGHPRSLGQGRCQSGRSVPSVSQQGLSRFQSARSVQVSDVQVVRHLHVSELTEMYRQTSQSAGPTDKHTSDEVWTFLWTPCPSRCLRSLPSPQITLQTVRSGQVGTTFFLHK